MSPGRRFDLRRLDVAAFAAQASSVEGRFALVELERLRDSQAADAGNGDAEVSWRLSGNLAPLSGAGIRPALRIEGACTVVLECQRCLRPMPVGLAVDRRVFFVEGESAAADLDEGSDDDVLALLPSIDARTLIEDELLLALPIVAAHDVCPEPLPIANAGAEPIDPAEHPFAALAALKSSR